MSTMVKGDGARRHRCTSKCSDGHENALINSGGNSHYGSISNSDSGGHCHDKNASVERLDVKARKKLIIASALCLGFLIIELVGGILANSLAIATDAAHLLTDFASFMISLFSIYLAARAPTKRLNFGWHRAEVMGALVSVLLIWVVTGVLVYMAVQRVITDDYEIDATIMLITAGIGVAFNVIMGISLHDAGHGHSHGGGGHGHSHGQPAAAKKPSPPPPQQQQQQTENGDSTTLILVEDKPSEEAHTAPAKVNINVRAAFIHVIGDFIQSLGVLVAAFIIFYKPEWKVADPICTFLFSVLVLFTTLNILRDAMNVLMEGTPKGLDFNAVKDSLVEISGVREIHNLRLWSLTMSKTALAVHLAIDADTNQQDLLAYAGRMLRDRYGVHECTIQMEVYCQAMEDCKDCQDPND